jgi:hypothetical protein
MITTSGWSGALVSLCNSLHCCCGTICAKNASLQLRLRAGTEILMNEEVFFLPATQGTQLHARAGKVKTTVGIVM